MPARSLLVTVGLDRNAIIGANRVVTKDIEVTAVDELHEAPIFSKKQLDKA